jgi:hypothetical protein
MKEFFPELFILSEPFLGEHSPASILRRAVTAKEGSSRLGVLWGLPPLSLVDMLLATGGGFST